MSQRPGAAQGAQQQWEGEFFCFFSRARLRVSPRRAGWARPNRCYALGWWRSAAPRGPAPPSARSGARISGKANINLRKTLPLAGRRPCRFRASAALSTNLTGLRAANRRIQRRRARSRAVSRPEEEAGGPRSLMVLSPPKSPVPLMALLPRLRSTAWKRLRFAYPQYPHIELEAPRRLGRPCARVYRPTAIAHSLLDNTDPRRIELTTVLAFI